ncbi:hypothetical protein P691DRAFT_800858 [Macrolepiota fuliginosa MF-IS2]|uniref:cAMP-independent regulatory protein n=1 Tax=Macrolepiota fuliginosa MF-IS2 TaxID=1400762 RepID=A0A9P5XF90_9AGAR|nr:hypothetical protein P691DRAFT_800858 [Macrolepiota fuliginosa MF-IS2]
MAAQHGNAHQNSPTWTEPPWSGWIETTGDALLILEAARRGLIPRVTRRLVDSERKMITSGSVFVFDEDESGIKRWTDGFFWSPSRILGNFLLYRETDKRGSSHRSGKDSDTNEYEGSKTDQPGPLSRPKSDPGHPGVDKHRERTLVGSLTNSYKFKPDGLMKKTFSLTIGGIAQHLISYYKIEDVESGRLRSPSSLPELASLEISPEYLDKTHFRNPPKVEVGADGILRYRGEADDIDTSASLLAGPPLTGLPLLSDKREVPESPSSKRPRYGPYAPTQSASKRQRKGTAGKALPTPTDSEQPRPTTPQQEAISPISNPTPQHQQQPQAPQGYDPNIPVAAAAPTSYPSFGVAPYYGYMQPPPHVYPHQAPYAASQPIPPPAQYTYAGYPAPAPGVSPPTPQAPPPNSAQTSPPSSASTNTPISPSDPSQPPPGVVTPSPTQPQATPQIHMQPGYYPPPPHSHAPPYYGPPPPPSGAAPHPHPHPHPQMYTPYPPPPHAGHAAPPPPGVWAHPHSHPHAVGPYGGYAAPPPPHQQYSYGVYAPPPGVQQAQAQHQQVYPQQQQQYATAQAQGYSVPAPVQVQQGVGGQEEKPGGVEGVEEAAGRGGDV